MDNNVNLDETYRLLVDATNDSLEQVAHMMPGTEEKSMETKVSAELLDRLTKLVDQNNKAAELECKLEAEEIQRKADKKSEIVKWIIHGIELGVTTAVTIYAVKAPLKTYHETFKIATKFEETGSYLSSVGRAASGKMSSLLNFNFKK